MAIFRRDSEPDSPPGTASRERPVRPRAAPASASRSRHTLIAPGTEMVGEITGATDVAIEGDLQGEVRIDGTVRVGPEGRVRGALEARVVEIGGKVKGDVRGRERIVLDASAELLGDLSAPRVEIHEGAFFKGAVEMTGDETAKERSRPDDKKDEKDEESAPKTTVASVQSSRGADSKGADSKGAAASDGDDGDEKGTGSDAPGGASEGDER